MIEEELMDALVEVSRRVMQKNLELLEIIPPISAPYHHSGGVGCQGCGSAPRFEVLAHLLDCEDSEVQHRTDADGNFVWRGCDQCYQEWRSEVERLLRRLRRYAPVRCRGCGKSVRSIADVMLRVRQL